MRMSILKDCRRHQDKHSRPYHCHYGSCNRKSFGDKGGLDRHIREVHGSQVYKCPVLSCKRNKRGFHRSYNLLMHQKKAHSSHASEPFASRSNTLDEMSKGEIKSPTPQHQGRVESPDGEEIGSGQIRGDTNVDIGRDLRMKLQALLVIRAELDEDIGSMERALCIMCGESP
jgi:hypothetical protein